MASREIPSPETLRKLLRYEPETGKLYWLPRDRSLFADNRSFGTWSARFIGKEAGSVKPSRRVMINVWGHMICAHRAAWAIFYGSWPSKCIDHINGDATDNRICNLRDCTQSENMKNARKRQGNTSGVTGVSWDKGTRKWRADLRHKGRTQYIGVFESLEEAATARKQAAKRLGFTDRHGT